MFDPPTGGFTQVEQDYLFEFITKSWRAHQTEGLSDGLHALQELDGLFPPSTRCYVLVFNFLVLGTRCQVRGLISVMCQLLGCRY